jgi:dTDP-4-amino-4,6-dideoxygalactose transaminase
MHLQPAYRGCRVIAGAIAEDLFRHGLCLPSGSALSPKGQQRVIDAFLQTPRLRHDEE